jgi:hypothetical protein
MYSEDSAKLSFWGSFLFSVNICINEMPIERMLETNTYQNSFRE